ncbi:hypothetical protein H4582DRAFT_1936382 [Lactarius indigo]|nr:hypothetical protein H4582DRAFT_1936382 [Lactarius indigo]
MHPFDEIKNAIAECFCLGHSAQYDVLEEQPTLDFPYEKKQYPRTTESRAEGVLTALFNAKANDEHLFQCLQEEVHETGWYEGLAKAVLNGLTSALENGKPMGQAMKDVYEKVLQVIADVWEFVKEHPIFFTLVALGILVVLAPWAIEALGFGELGPIEGTFAALWQSKYGGYVPAGSLFSFFQRLGMVWKLS